MTMLQDFFNEKIKLPSPPAVALKILSAVRQDESTFNELAEIIAVDPALTARILKLTNSSYYSLPNPVGSLSQATALIGSKTLQNIALSFVIVQRFQDSPQGSFDLDFFWKRAITSAVSAEMLSKKIQSRNDDIFVSALLQDIGVLIMFLSDPPAYTEVLDNKRINDKTTRATEEEQFGFDHTEVGYHLLKTWNLSDAVCCPIRYHHNEEKPKQYQDTAQLLQLADTISAIYHGTESNRKSIEVHNGLAATYQFTAKQSADLIDAVGEKAREVMGLFDIAPGNMKPFSQIMQEANDELGRLNFSYEQIVLELKQAKQNAEQLAMNLKDANENLKKLAFRDGLTGLYNHRYFQEVFEREIQKATRFNHPVSLLFLDIDHFKTVNDTYGHPTGDEVLKNVSQLLVKLVRKCDIVARYGGEEFAVILPETGTASAKVLAQRVRRGVEQLLIQYNDLTISVTVSVGLASSGMKETSESRSTLISQSDQALYRAKTNGRNRVEIAQAG